MLGQAMSQRAARKAGPMSSTPPLDVWVELCSYGRRRDFDNAFIAYDLEVKSRLPAQGMAVLRRFTTRYSVGLTMHNKLQKAGALDGFVAPTGGQALVYPPGVPPRAVAHVCSWQHLLKRPCSQATTSVTWFTTMPMSSFAGRSWRHITPG